jgi:hypothetical protein
VLAACIKKTDSSCVKSKSQSPSGKFRDITQKFSRAT